jgi:hypothetical protein
MTSRALFPALVIAASACGGSDPAVPADVIDRETFIATYVELRNAAIATPDFQVTPELRAEILARHGVDAEDLIRFAEAHGEDLDYMNAVWIEVETRIEGREVIPDPVR